MAASRRAPITVCRCRYVTTSSPSPRRRSAMRQCHDIAGVDDLRGSYIALEQPLGVEPLELMHDIGDVEPRRSVHPRYGLCDLLRRLPCVFVQDGEDLRRFLAILARFVGRGEGVMVVVRAGLVGTQEARKDGKEAPEILA